MKLIPACILAVVAMSSPAFAACANFPIITPNTAPVDRPGMASTGAPRLNGTAYTVATFCPAKAAAGTCTGESLSERVAAIATNTVTYDGDVADILRHRNGIQIGPVFIPLTGYLPGAC